MVWFFFFRARRRAARLGTGNSSGGCSAESARMATVKCGPGFAGSIAELFICLFVAGMGVVGRLETGLGLGRPCPAIAQPVNRSGAGRLCRRNLARREARRTDRRTRESRAEKERAVPAVWVAGWRAAQGMRK
jgi:hypothetical protein